MATQTLMGFAAGFGIGAFFRFIKLMIKVACGSYIEKSVEFMKGKFYFDLIAR
jgi:hypothetical protein